VVAGERRPGTERDRVALDRIRYQLSGPKTFREISHVPRRRADRGAALVEVFDLSRCVICSAGGSHRLQPGQRHQVRLRRDRTIRKLDGRARFGAFFSGERNAHGFAYLVRKG
jgi:hypothetical protein